MPSAGVALLGFLPAFLGVGAPFLMEIAQACASWGGAEDFFGSFHPLVSVLALARLLSARPAHAAAAAPS